MFLDQPLNSLDLSGSEPIAAGQSDWIKPKLGLESLAFDVHMHWLRMVGRVKVKPVWPKSKNRGQRSQCTPFCDTFTNGRRCAKSLPSAFPEHQDNRDAEGERS
jgi:hypothetical protein